MRYYKDILLGSELEYGEVDKLKRGLTSHSVFAICVCSLSPDLFEIMSTYELLKEYNQKRDYAVVALVNGKNNAKAAIAEIIEVWFRKYKSLEGIKEYYNNNSL